MTIAALWLQQADQNAWAKDEGGLLQSGRDLELLEATAQGCRRAAAGRVNTAVNETPVCLKPSRPACGHAC